MKKSHWITWLKKWYYKNPKQRISVLIFFSFSFYLTLYLFFFSPFIHKEMHLLIKISNSFILAFVTGGIGFLLLQIFNLAKRKFIANLSDVFFYILFIIVFIIIIPLIFYLNNILLINNLNAFSYFDILFQVCLFMIFPIILLMYFSEKLYYINALRTARYISDKEMLTEDFVQGNDKLLIIQTELKSDFRVLINQLICIKADDNYITVFYREKGKTTRTMLRVSLKSIQQQLDGEESLIRCHRSYIINTEYIDNIVGNSQGYKILLKTIEFPIPVSRNFPKSVINSLISKSRS